MTIPVELPAARTDARADAPHRDAEPTETNIRALVDAFYERVRDDALLGPVFDAKLAGRWDQHLPKMAAFWSNLVLGTKGYRGNLQAAHQPLDGLEPAHFSRWLALFLKIVEARYEPAAAVRFMEPALRIAQSLQLSRFGWDYEIPDEQKAILALVAPPRRRPDDDDGHAASAAARSPRGEPSAARNTGQASNK